MCFIAPKVNLITINHDPDPENRSATYGRPIVIEDKVWIGINSTVLPGVRIGYGAIVGANSVVTHDGTTYDCGRRQPGQIHQKGRNEKGGINPLFPLPPHQSDNKPASHKQTISACGLQAYLHKIGVGRTSTT